MHARYAIPVYLVVLFALAVMLVPEAAYASTLSTNSCDSGGGEPLEKVFSTILCNFMSTLTNVLNILLPKFYGKLGTISQTLGTLYILLYGIEVLVAPSSLNAKEALGRMAKVTVVVGLMTGAGSNMSHIYQFFMSLATDFPSEALAGMKTGSWLTNATTPDGIYNSLDAVAKEIVDKQEFMGMDMMKLIGFAAVLILVVPQLGGALLQLFTELFNLLVNSLVGIFLAMATITFLISLGPIFIGFLLFQQTEHLFNNWWKHLASYSLQIVFVIASIGLWSAAISSYDKFIPDLEKAVQPYNKNLIPAGTLNSPTATWGICKGKKDGVSGYKSSCSTPDISPQNIMKDGKDFMAFFFYNLASLLCLTYGFSALVKAAPGIAQQIAGASGGAGDAGGSGIGGFIKRKVKQAVKRI